MGAETFMHPRDRHWTTKFVDDDIWSEKTRKDQKIGSTTTTTFGPEKTRKDQKNGSILLPHHLPLKERDT